MHPAIRQVLGEHNDLAILATFPGETWDERAVYVRRQAEPAFVLLYETWWHDAISAALTRLAARLPTLAERWGCPVAGLVSARLWFMDRSALPALLEQARRQDVLLVVVASAGIQFSHPQGLLSWQEPSHRSRPVPLPPFPRPGWPFLQDLRPLIREFQESAPAGRHKAARDLAWRALERLKYTPALLLTREPDGVLAETGDLIAHLLPLPEREEGRRYMIWSLFYLAAGLCLDPQLSQRSWPSVKAVLDAMARGWGSWTTKEQRVIVRGLGLLARKAAEAGIPPENPLWAELRRWADTFLDKPKVDSWRWSFRVQEFMHALAGARALPPTQVYTMLRQHEERGRFLQEILRGMAEDFWAAPSIERWEELQRLFYHAPTSQHWLRQFVRIRLETGMHRKFWDFLHTLGQQEHPRFLAWISLLIEAVHGLEKRRLSPEAQTELRTVLELALQRQIASPWLAEQMRQVLDVLTRENP
jgi:hypothetical protein